MRMPAEDRAAVGQPIDLAPETMVAILRVIEEGWARAQVRGATAEIKEVPLTEKLRDGMRLANSRPPSMIVLAGTETRSTPDVPKPDGHTDIPLMCINIFLQFAEHDPHAIIECKRVAAGDADLCREYVVNGIDRFRDGKYSGRHTAAFMAGYVLVGTFDAVVHGINSYLARQRRLGERLEPSTLINDPWCRESKHARLAHGPIALYHAFLSFASHLRC